MTNSLTSETRNYLNDQIDKVQRGLDEKIIDHEAATYILNLALTRLLSGYLD